MLKTILEIAGGIILANYVVHLAGRWQARRSRKAAESRIVNLDARIALRAKQAAKEEAKREAALRAPRWPFTMKPANRLTMYVAVVWGIVMLFLALAPSAANEFESQWILVTLVCSVALLAVYVSLDAIAKR